MVSGTAGTGKSFVVKCVIKQAREQYGEEQVEAAVRLAAPTGTAAFNIGGRTLHSLLGRPVPLPKDLPKLNGQALTNLQVRLKGMRMLIIDEMSMIGRRFLAAIDARLREVFPAKSREWFGGVSVCMMGDFGQLPPVMDLAMFNEQRGEGLSGKGLAVFRSFRKAVVLKKVERQGGDDPTQVAFRELLGRLRDGKVTVEDWRLLSSRAEQKLPAEEAQQFQWSQKLVSTHAAEAKVNEERLRALGKPVARLQAVHVGPGAQTQKGDDAGGLEPVVRLCEGARVMLRQNLWTEAGLTNGSLGTVYGVLYSPDSQGPPDLPLAVLVQFDGYVGPPFLPGVPGLVPVPTRTTKWEKKVGQPCSRTQVPLCLSFAITIHKSQGWTCEKVRLDLGTAEHSLGIAFVAISRAKSLAGIMFQPEETDSLAWKRFEAVRKAKGHDARRKVDTALQEMHDQLARELA